MVYHVAAVAVLYNLESHTQRHYMGHTNDIESMNVHPGALALVATGQAEGHDHVNCTIQKPHVQVNIILCVIYYRYKKIFRFSIKPTHRKA